MNGGDVGRWTPTEFHGESGTVLETVVYGGSVSNAQGAGKAKRRNRRGAVRSLSVE